MVNPNRVESYIFSAGSLTADSNGRFSVHSDYVINGEVLNINYLIGNFDANGSLFLMISGTNEMIWSKIGGLGTSSISYPFVYGVDREGSSGSPFSYCKRVANAPLRIVGSGLGNGTSGTEFHIFYN